MINDEIEAKRLEILSEMLPTARRFAVLMDRTIVPPARFQALEGGARALGVQLQTIDVHSPADFAAALETLHAGGTEGVNILASAAWFASDQLRALASMYNLPAICSSRQMAAAGCLASYATSAQELTGTLADLTDKMLRGASPADTPVRQPTKFELVVNLKTAKALGLTIPPLILARADEVIE
jgi:putative tryptophan/tyrosine transport system substrate-binding protein